jgi:hypothetical protein
MSSVRSVTHVAGCSKSAPRERDKPVRPGTALPPLTVSFTYMEANAPGPKEEAP